MTNLFDLQVPLNSTPMLENVENDSRFKRQNSAIRIGGFIDEMAILGLSWLKQAFVNPEWCPRRDWH